VSDQEMTVQTLENEREFPGKFLRDAREAQGLTVGEVAGVIKFNPRQIEALEGDDFDQLQGKTFLRGFVRAYARMLKLPAEPLLSMLDDEALPEMEQVIPPDNMGETNPTPFYRKYAKALLAFVLLAAAGVGIAWFVVGQPTYHQSATPVAAQPEAIAPVDIALPSVENSATAAEQNSATATVPVTLSGTAAAQPAASSPALTFQFSDLSWLEVKDGSGQTLLTGEFSSGEKKTLTGKPPYQIWIGKASAVKVTYKDQPVDLQPYVREEVARFTLEH
jgi:cytoskeleton protein RodZ